MNADPILVGTTSTSSLIEPRDPVKIQRRRKGLKRVPELGATYVQVGTDDFYFVRNRLSDCGFCVVSGSWALIRDDVEVVHTRWGERVPLGLDNIEGNLAAQDALGGASVGFACLT